MGVGLPNDLVLRHEARERRYSADRERRGEESPERNGHLVAQRTHLAHVLLAAHGMDDGTRAKEQASLEERMRHQVEDASGVCAHADADENIDELADRRIGEDFLDVDMS